MRILINASNLKIGGGIQVADSVCRELYKYSHHTFVVVLADTLKKCAEDIKSYPNTKIVHYTLPYNIFIAVTGHDKFLDTLVAVENIEAVLTIFGPSRWIPKCMHVSGFARSQLVLLDSPYWHQLSYFNRIKAHFRGMISMHLFRKSASVFYTENSYISVRLKKLLPDKVRVYTVTNNYNQIFDMPERWDRFIKLPEFNGLTLLTISANYPHKNLSIIIPTIHYLKKKYPFFIFRFVLTITSEQFIPVTEKEKEHIVFLGPISITQCPSLYEQSDIMFLPTLLECFSASYAEAMKMNVPILTTNLEFAKSLCGNAALYYDAVSFQDLAEAIYKLANNTELRKELVAEGKRQLLGFDNSEERVSKLLGILEKESKMYSN